ncbi:LysR family transcriptional regulator [Salinisphaera orenii]|uniref:LysR family transcriptional regulator n=1 Tax=Salinisphaera orenii YIM 95161 TaxID=1051139 RepID=A0A423PTU0_9GAMM|nr:LysR family transcriptional regulator [Salinisphaera halophila]ROO28988.1 LysR family transcriptional regulator [Salinisphaera halophila YIM 95161]
MDLNLVRTFVTLYECRSVSAAARRLHVTQPTVSYGLARLRERLADRLFVRARNGIRPTAVAVQLYPALSASLVAIDDALEQGHRFDAARSTRRFVIALSDLGELTLLPDILAAVESSAPGVRITVVALDVERVAEDLARGDIDAAICSRRLGRDDLERRQVLCERYVGVARGEHPRIGDTPDLAAFLREHHVRIDAGSGHGLAEEVLADSDVQRKMRLTVPRFSSLPTLIGRSDLLAIVPAQIAARFVRDGGLRMFELPFHVPRFDVALYTHAAGQASAAQRWFAQTVLSAARAATRDAVGSA